jgi:tetratricopeptide (TPR) repeat protein
LQGRLPEVAAEGEATRTAVAAFLMGQTDKLPRHVLGCAVPRVQLLLYLGRLSMGRESALLEGLYREIGWESDRARCLLLLAEACRCRSDEAQAHHCLVEASRWILHSGSVEHLCLYHLTRARLLRTAAEHKAAQRALAEGLHLAERSALGLYHVELLCERAELLLAQGDAAGAEQAARDALERARDPKCAFAWGEAEAGHLLGQALIQGGRHAKARKILTKTRDLRRALGHPGVNLTERALARLTG